MHTVSTDGYPQRRTAVIADLTSWRCRAPSPSICTDARSPSAHGRMRLTHPVAMARRPHAAPAVRWSALEHSIAILAFCRQPLNALLTVSCESSED